MRLVRSATLRLVPILVASACGGRSALDDERRLIGDDDDGVAQTGGRSGSGGSHHFGSGGRLIFETGGASSTGAAPSTGGLSPAGAASSTGSALSTGGSFATGGSSGCIVGGWGGGENCVAWTTCEPGRYVLTPGTSTSDRVCADCPPDGYTNARNQASCAYSGCNFSELVMTPATGTSPAECAPDPEYFDLGSDGSIIGLTHRGAHAELAIAESGRAELSEYGPGAPFDIKTVSYGQGALARAFALAPNGTIYLQGTSGESPPVRWLQAYAPDLSPAWQDIVGTEAAGKYGSGILTTDSHWLSWQFGGETLGAVLTLMTAPHPTPAPTSTTTVTGFTRLDSIAVDDQETVWFTGIAPYDAVLMRVIGTSGTLELVQTLPALGNRSLVTVTPSGTAYVLVEEAPHHFVLFSVNSTLNREDVGSYASEQGILVTAMTMAVDPGRAVYVCFAASSAISLWNVILLKLDLQTQTISTKTFFGPGSEWTFFITVTSDGSVYLAGEADGSSFLRRAD